jgi:hypothetical protein
MLEGEGEAIVRRVLDMALAGDQVALRLCFERLVPPRRSRPVRLDLPKLTSAADLPAAHDALLQAAARGDLTPDEAATLAGLLEARRRAVETTELAEDVAALKRHLEAKP